MAWELELSEAVLEDLYAWIDNIPLSRPKRKIERDFADGVLAAEVIRHYLPDLINIHNYVSNSSVGQKRINWHMLNKKVFSRLKLNVPEAILIELSNGKAGRIELFLFNLKLKIDEELEARQKRQQILQQQIQSQADLSPRQSLLSLNNLPIISDEKPTISKRTHRTSRSIGNLSSKWVSRLDFEELNEQCLGQQEEIDILHAKLRRLENVILIKDSRIEELSSLVDDYRHFRPVNRPKKK